MNIGDSRVLLHLLVNEEGFSLLMDGTILFIILISLLWDGSSGGEI